MMHHWYYNVHSPESRKLINVQAMHDDAQKALTRAVDPHESIIHYHAADAECDKSHHESYLWANTIAMAEKAAADPEFELKSKQHRWEHQ